MIGTNKELLLYLTTERCWFKKAGLDLKTANNLVNRLRYKTVSEASIDSVLKALGCVMLRPKTVVPSVWEKYGIRYSSVTAMRFELSRRCWYKPLGFNRYKAKDIKKREGRLSEKEREAFLSMLGYTKLIDSYTLPSVWEYANWFVEEEPLYVRQHIVDRLIYNPEEDFICGGSG